MPTLYLVKTGTSYLLVDPNTGRISTVHAQKLATRFLPERADAVVQRAKAVLRLPRCRKVRLKEKSLAA